MFCICIVQNPLNMRVDFIYVTPPDQKFLESICKKRTKRWNMLLLRQHLRLSGIIATLSVVSSNLARRACQYELSWSTDKEGKLYILLFGNRSWNKTWATRTKDISTTHVVLIFFHTALLYSGHQTFSIPKAAKKFCYRLSSNMQFCFIQRLCHISFLSGTDWRPEKRSETISLALEALLRQPNACPLLVVGTTGFCKQHTDTPITYITP